MLTPHRIPTLFSWCGSVPSPASSNPPSNVALARPTVILENLKAQTVIAIAGPEHEVCFEWRVRACWEQGWGRKGSFHPCLCPRRWLWFGLSFVPICSQTHVTLVGLSWICLWLAVRLTQFLFRPHIHPWTNHPSLVYFYFALLGNTLLVEPGTDLHFFHLRSDINFLLIDICLKRN